MRSLATYMNVPIITITDTAPFHLRIMSDAMQENSAKMAQRVGYSPLKALWANYRQSLICKSVFINGNLCAIFGVVGMMLGESGAPWIALTPEVEQYPMRVAFRFKKELEEMLKLFPVLEDYIEEENTAAIRFMSLMGFRVSKNITTMAGINFRRAERRG